MATKMREFIVKVFYRQDAKGEHEHNRSDLTEEVVRCRKCVNYYKNAPKSRDYYLPHHDCYRDDDEWFCADGKRAEG